jgi:phosphoglycerate dehydrogenase-like enzyme
LLTPHIGAYTLEANRRMAEVSAVNLAEMLETGP